MVAPSIAWAEPWFTELVDDELCYDSHHMFHEDFHVVNEGDGYHAAVWYEGTVGSALDMKATSIMRGAHIICCAVALAGCTPDLPPAPPRDSAQSFGEKFFTISCQRVAYTSSLATRDRALTAREEDPTILVPSVDVSGSSYRLACRYGPEYLPPEATFRAPKVATLVEHYRPLVDAVNLIFPGDELSDLQDYMVRILPLTDDDSFPALVRTGARVLEDLETDGDFHWSLARLDGRTGYRPRPVYLGLIRELLQYPDLHGLLSQLLELVAEGGDGHERLLQLVEALSYELRTTRHMDSPLEKEPLHPADPERPLRLVLDLLLREDPAFASEQTPLLLARRDWRGIAAVHRASTTGILPAPFVDSDHDGQADVDLLGRFVTRDGTAAPAPFRLDQTAPDTARGRDPEGRAIDENGAPLYEYVNLDRTLLAALSRDALELLRPDQDIAFKLLLGLSGLMGGRKDATKAYDGAESLSYSGFDTARAAVLDLVYAALQLFRDPAIDATLDTGSLLLRNHPGETARAVGAALDAKERGKQHPEAQIDPQANLYDDLVLVVRDIVNTPGLLEDVIHALADPRLPNVGTMLANYCTYRDVHDLDQQTLQVLNPFFKETVDRSQPDSGYNRSIMQRLLHVLSDTHGMKFCNKEGAIITLEAIGIKGLPITVAGPFKVCELFEIENGAVFYAQTIARLRDANGNLTSTPKAHFRMKLENIEKQGTMGTLVASAIRSVGEDKVLNMLTGIEGFSSHPTTEAINRSMFLDPLRPAMVDLQDPAVDVDGHQVNTYHVGSLLSLEVKHPQFSCTPSDPCQFLETLRPVVQAFADHEAERLLVDFFRVLHRHWPSRKSEQHQFESPGAPNFAWGSAVVTWEPLLIEIFGSTDLLPSVLTLAGILDLLQLSDGTPAKTMLGRTVAFLVDPTRSPGLTYRDGRTTSMTTDGKSTVAGGVSVFYLLADAFAAKRRALDDLATGTDKRLADAWKESTSDLVDLFLAVEGTGNPSRFKNPRLVPAGLLLLDFLRDRVRSHRARLRTPLAGPCKTDAECVSAFGPGSRCLPGPGACQGDLVTWLRTTLPQSIEETLGGPVVARAVDFLRLLDTETATKDAVYALLNYLVDEARNNAAFRSTLTGVADVAQLVLDDTDLVPLARALGRALDSKLGLLEAALRFLKPALAADSGDLCQPGNPSCGPGETCVAVSAAEWRCSKETLSRILRHAYQEQSPGKSPVQTLLDLATELHRLFPGEGTPYTGFDFAEALSQARDFLANQETGLEKFFEIVTNRCGGSC
jgi:hypothetical protein